MASASLSWDALVCLNLRNHQGFLARVSNFILNVQLSLLNIVVPVSIPSAQENRGSGKATKMVKVVHHSRFHPAKRL